MNPQDVKTLESGGQQAIVQVAGLRAGGLHHYLPPAERLRLLQEDLEYQRGALDLVNEHVTKSLKAKVDFDVIPGTKKPALLQPGAQKVCQALGLLPTYSVREVDDPTRQTPYRINVWVWENRNRVQRVEEGNAQGYYAATVTCTLTGTHLTGPAQGIGTCSNLETKYVRKRCEDVRHTVLMIAAKRAYVAATRTVGCLSDRFTQDTEDMPPELLNGEETTTEEAAQAVAAGARTATPTPAKQPTKPATPAPAPRASKPPAGPPPKPTGIKASPAQISRMWALAHQAAAMRHIEKPYDKVKEILKTFGCEDAEDVTRDIYDSVVGRILAWGDGKE